MQVDQRSIRQSRERDSEGASLGGARYRPPRISRCRRPVAPHSGPIVTRDSPASAAASCRISLVRASNRSVVHTADEALRWRVSTIEFGCECCDCFGAGLAEQARSPGRSAAVLRQHHRERDTVLQICRPDNPAKLLPCRADRTRTEHGQHRSADACLGVSSLYLFGPAADRP